MNFYLLNNPETKTIEQIIKLYKAQGWFTPGDDLQRYKNMVNGSHAAAVCEHGGQIIAFARAISDRANDAYIQDVTVLKEFRKQGIASKLVNMLVFKLKQDGLKWIGLIASDGSDPLYAKAGFTRMENSNPMLMEL